MVTATKAALLLVLTWRAAASPLLPSDLDLLEPASTIKAPPERQLHGRFAVITDIHPDPHYRTNASESSGCHRAAPKHETSRAGYWGQPVSDCDSPLTLVDTTFDWLAKRWAGEIDFVIWTGDSARHDIDSRIPRSFIEIVGLNENMVKRMQKAFGRRLPIVPSVGNNDLFPHNIMFAGPSAVVNSLQTVWRDMIPESEFHTFARGAYFSTEVVPGLIVVSLNTIYFFASNKVVDGCPLTRKGQSDPGTEQLAWLETRLERWREDGKQVWLTGHVPIGSWYSNCAARFSELAVAYQDIIVGSLSGHANVDFFTWTDASQTARTSSSEPLLHTRSSARALEDGLKADYKGLKRVDKLNLDDFALFHVTPSVIPTYQPAVRIYTYNTTVSTAYRPRVISYDDDEVESLNLYTTVRQSFFGSDRVETERRERRRKDKKRKKKHDGPSRVPRHASPFSPSRMNRYLTPLGYTQWMLDLEKANAAGPDVTPEWEIEYTTYAREDLSRYLRGEKREGETLPIPWMNATEGGEMVRRMGWEELAPYEMKDLTIGRWLDLAYRLGKGAKLWKGFRKRLFVSTDV